MKQLSLILLILFLSCDNNKKHENKSIQNVEWIKGNFTDDFGDNTSEVFITTKKSILGKFSNSATTNSDLKVKVFIEKNSLWFRIYKYEGDTPFRPLKYDKHFLLAKMNGNKVDLENNSLLNYKDALGLNKASSKQLIDMLSSGGNFQFVIKNQGSTDASYNFTIEVSKGLSELYYNEFILDIIDDDLELY